LTKKEGVFSFVKGLKPAYSLPCFFSETVRPITSDGRRRDLSSSRNSGLKRGMAAQCSVNRLGAEATQFPVPVKPGRKDVFLVFLKQIKKTIAGENAGSGLFHLDRVAG